MSDETRDSIREAIAGVLHRHDAVSGAWWTEGQVASLQSALVEAIERAACVERPATPAAGEDVRERVVWLLSLWGDELEAHWEDPEDDVEPPGPGQIADEILALLRTPSGEGEASRRLLWEAARVLGEIGGALEGPHDSVDWGVLRTDLRRVRRRLTAAALRSEAPGEVDEWVEDDGDERSTSVFLGAAAPPLAWQLSGYDIDQAAIAGWERDRGEIMRLRERGVLSARDFQSVLSQLGRQIAVAVGSPLGHFWLEVPSGTSGPRTYCDGCGVSRRAAEHFGWVECAARRGEGGGHG